MAENLIEIGETVAIPIKGGSLTLTPTARRTIYSNLDNTAITTLTFHAELRTSSDKLVGNTVFSMELGPDTVA